MTFRVVTARLHVRPWEADDRPDLARLATDVDMMRYVTRGRPWSDEEVDEFLARQARHLAVHGCCIGPLVHNQTGLIVGIAGIQPLDRPGDFELGWWTWKEHWGRGYATEIARALLEHARTAMSLRRIVAMVDPPNAASIRVAEKIGMRLDRTVSANELAAHRDDVVLACYVIDF